MNKKLFVVLEQGNKCNTKLSIEHKRQFTTKYSDWFRLNWKADKNDKEAHFYKDNIVWTEGRSFLFEKVKGKYKYYIFIDDDVKFISKTNKTVSEELKHFFENYNPLTGTIFGDNWAWDLYKNKINKEVFPIMGHDLCCHYFQEDFANCMFPIYFDGSGRSMWYSQFISYKLYPNKCMVYNNIIVKNTEHVPHCDMNKKQFVRGEILVKKFADLLIKQKDKQEFLSWNKPKFVRTLNKKIYEIDKIDKKKIVFNKKDLNSIIKYIYNAN